MKAYTDLEQSKKLAEFLPIESADMLYYCNKSNNIPISQYPFIRSFKENGTFSYLYCWSLAALLGYLHKFKPQVYIPILSPTENKWMLNFVKYGHGTICKVTCDNPVDACYEMIIKLHELNILGL